MPRTHYANGDAIGLPATGRDGCTPNRINGVLSHEHGCPYAWRDHQVECFECGSLFFPEARSGRTCPSCVTVAC
jgi:hypothetical protein